jgi:hypothetical protein
MIFNIFNSDLKSVTAQQKEVLASQLNDSFTKNFKILEESLKCLLHQDKYCYKPGLNCPLHEHIQLDTGIL